MFTSYTSYNKNLCIQLGGEIYFSNLIRFHLCHLLRYENESSKYHTHTYIRIGI